MQGELSGSPGRMKDERIKGLFNGRILVIKCACLQINGYEWLPCVCDQKVSTGVK